MEKKYLKYKNKYLNLKKQFGGLTIPNITDTTVHNYYKHSKLYNLLQKEKGFNNNELSFNINNKFYNESFIINNKEDFKKVIRIMTYWGFNTLPIEVFNFALQNKQLVKNLLETNINKNTVSENNKNFIEIIRPLNTDIYQKLRIIVLNSNNDLTRLFAKGGHLDCLKYAHENGCPWDEGTCSYAAEYGHLDCLKYAHENGCPWNEDIFFDIYEDESDTCSLAAGGGHLDCLKYAHENGCEWYVGTCAYAAGGGHLNCLKYVHDNGCEWNEWTCAFAAKRGHLDCLKYAHNNGCEWDESTCSGAAGGHLDCLKYAHENGCPWSAATCFYAAMGGHLDCLIYAHENGCPWDSMTSYIASREKGKGHMDCYEYAISHGCPT